jgi:hypothetical protein
MAEAVTEQTLRVTVYVYAREIAIHRRALREIAARDGFPGDRARGDARRKSLELALDRMEQAIHALDEVRGHDPGRAVIGTVRL